MGYDHHCTVYIHVYDEVHVVHVHVFSLEGVYSTSCRTCMSHACTHVNHMHTTYIHVQLQHESAFPLYLYMNHNSPGPSMAMRIDLEVFPFLATEVHGHAPYGDLFRGWGFPPEISQLSQ